MPRPPSDRIPIPLLASHSLTLITSGSGAARTCGVHIAKVRLSAIVNMRNDDAFAYSIKVYAPFAKLHAVRISEHGRSTRRNPYPSSTVLGLTICSKSSPAGKPLGLMKQRSWTALLVRSWSAPTAAAFVLAIPAMIGLARYVRRRLSILTAC